MPRIMIVEDDLVLRMELEELLSTEGYEVLGSVGSGPEAIALAEEISPILILMDIKLSGEMDGITAVEKIKSKRNIPIVFLTGHSEPEIVQRAAMVNPQGFILKPYHGPQIRAAIEIALNTPEKVNRLTNEHDTIASLLGDTEFSAVLTEKIPDLTTAELRIAHLVRRGLRTKEIAEKLEISKHTVSWHRNNIRTKLGLNGKSTNLIAALGAW